MHVSFSLSPGTKSGFVCLRVLLTFHAILRLCMKHNIVSAVTMTGHWMVPGC